MKREKKRWTSKKSVRILTVTVLVFLAIRLILPYVILKYANKSLAEMKGYYGRIKDINLALLRGAYKINDIYINKKDTATGEETEFFKANTIDLSIHWGALLKGKIVGELSFSEPNLIFTKERAEPAQVKEDTTDFTKVLKDLMPLSINRFDIENGVIRYVDQLSSPPVDIYMSDINVTAENLTNVESSSVLPATVTAEADIYGGTLDFRMQLDPLAKTPTFDMNAELKNTNLVELNTFFKAYGKFDVTKGQFGLYTEGAAKDNRFVGYVKPLIKDLKVIGPEDKEDKLLRKFWEGIVGATGIIFRNFPEDQVATKIPIEGSFGETKVNIWFAILDILRNAFIDALEPSIDNQINIKTVNGNQGTEIFEEPDKEEKKGVLKKIFNKKDKKEKEETNSDENKSGSNN